MVIEDLVAYLMFVYAPELTVPESTVNCAVTVVPIRPLLHSRFAVDDQRFFLPEVYRG